MAACKRCGGKIVFCWSDKGRWLPIDPESVDVGYDEDFEGGYLLQNHHKLHRCSGWASEKRWDNPPERPSPQTQMERCYATLYLLPTAPLEVAMAVHRALSRIHHPDVGGDTRRMQDINAAMDKIRGGR